MQHKENRTPRLNVVDLRCEYFTNPIGIDAPHPRLSWRITSDQRGVLQTAYQVRVAATPQALQKGDLIWDSGRVESEQSLHIPYGGPALRSGQRCYWQVRVWEDDAPPSAWSEIAFWEMGLLNVDDWVAEWIQPDIEEDTSTSPPSPLLRKGFHVSGPVRSARLYVTAHGLYEARLNGRRVGDLLFTPGWTAYHKRLQYQTYDVTDMLVEGENAAGVILGDGWYRGYIGFGGQRNFYGERLALLFQLHITYDDGRTQVVCSDGSWKSSTGPILESDIYNGERYDARLEKPGWDAPGYDDGEWHGVVVGGHSKSVLIAPAGPPVRRIQEIHPRAIIHTPAGETVFDMGQNMVGWVRLRVRGRPGDTVTLRHAEVLDQDGNLYTANLRSARQTDTYVLKGEGEEIFEPHFTFHGFRYVAVDGYPGEPTLDSITGIVIHSDLEPTGSFECDYPPLNQLQHNIVWGQKGNFLDVPTDCPQRDERLGWTGDAQVFSRTACFNMNAAGFFAKWLRDLAVEQYPDGRVPHVIPDVLGDGGSAAWADAVTICPWTLYLCYGDKRILRELYPAMKAWVGYVEREAGDSYLWTTGSHFGDWLAYNSPDPSGTSAVTDHDLIATAFFARSADILSRVARVLGEEQDARYYADLVRKIREAFMAEFVTPNGRVANNTQTAYVLALAFDLLPAGLRPEAARRLVADIRKRDNHLTTGFVGASYLCPTLSDNGHHDVAYDLLFQETYPSWLYPLTWGATTVWERWDGIRPDGSFQDPGMNSFNHYAYGAIGDWLYREVAGIDIDPTAPAYKHVLIHPHSGGKLRHVRATHRSPYGPIHSEWTLDDENFELRITLPANTTATVRLPGARLDAVRESGRPLEGAEGVKQACQDGDEVVIELGSGHYRFTVSIGEEVDAEQT